MYIAKTKSLQTADSVATTTTMEDKFNAASLPPPSTSSASDKPDNDESSLMEIGNWFMSLSRRRKSFSNKENNQNVSSTLMAETSQTNQSNNSLVNNSCNSSANGSSGETGSGLACTTKKITSSKNSNNNILFVLGKCLKLKFRAKQQQNDLMSLTSTVASRRGIPAAAVLSTVDRCTSNGILNTDTILQHQNMAISNAYVECPSPPLPTTTADTAITSSTVSLSMTQASNSFTLSSQNITPHVRPNFNEMTDIERASNPAIAVSSIEQAMHEEKLSMNAYGWYRGSLSRCVAQKKLQGQPDGSFLIRDSQTKGCNFTLSFRSAGITLHYRIENSDGDW